MLVKVGDGLWSLVKMDLIAADRMSLLKALKHDEAFEVKLRDVALDDCTVRVCTSASNKAPSDKEVVAARELEGAEALGDLAADMAGNQFIHVQLPALAAAGGGGKLAPVAWMR